MPGFASRPFVENEQLTFLMCDLILILRPAHFARADNQVVMQATVFTADLPKNLNHTPHP